MKILITGGAGFIGSHIADTLIKRHNVCVVDNFSSGKLENLNTKIKYYNIDINDSKLENVFEIETPDIVIHLAAQISVAQSQLNPQKDASVNIMGSLNTIALAKKYNVKTFIAASSAAIYGNLQSPISENSFPEPLSNYGISKLTMEYYIKSSGLNYLILRFSNVFGERQNANGEAGVITIFNAKMQAGNPVYIHGDGEQIRDFIYVKDLALIIEKLIEQNIHNDIINVSTGKGLNINELFSIMKYKNNYKNAPIYDDAREGDIKISILDNRKLLQYLPSFKFTNIEDAFKFIGVDDEKENKSCITNR